ncbi:hypothetical protein F5141DRAFT_1068941 [Pisolithus sp. B1]|nr:hypothetical protein F5141DRAFT_1068941 [Pisolithus sp. B1]
MSLWSPEQRKQFPELHTSEFHQVTGVGVRLDGSEAGFRQTITHEYGPTYSLLSYVERKKAAMLLIQSAHLQLGLSSVPQIQPAQLVSNPVWSTKPSNLLILFHDKSVIVDELKELEFNIELWGKAFRLGEESLVGINTLKPIGDEFREDAHIPTYHSSSDETPDFPTRTVIKQSHVTGIPTWMRGKMNHCIFYTSCLLVPESRKQNDGAFKYRLIQMKAQRKLEVLVGTQIVR